MRRGRRIREKNSNFKYLIYLSSGMLLVILLTFVITFVVYNNKLKKSSYSTLTTEKIADLVPNIDIIDIPTEQTSKEIGKTIEEAIKESEKNTSQGNTQTQNKQLDNEKDENLQVATTSTNTTEKIQIKDPEFIKPVDGDIIRDFAKDSLIYSETLQEWITHLGIDIKADRTTVVKAAEEGTVTAIKSDPRYGLTIIVEHVNGFKSIYSNLLTTEFISEGEKVMKSQSLGTIGNSAPFEIADEPHLHFEILKDNVNLDPKIYF